MNRYLNSLQTDMIMSLHLCSHCDFVVFTHLLNVSLCEIMQMVKQADFFSKVVSLDTIYFFHGQQNRQQIFVIGNRPELFEFDLIVGCW